MRFPHPSRSQLGVGALVIAALAVGQFLHLATPDRDHVARPFIRQVDLGETVSLRYGDLEPVGVTGGMRVVPSFGDPMTTTAVFVRLEFRFTPRSAAEGIAYGELIDADERISVVGSGSRSAIACSPFRAGVEAECSAVIEADPSTLPGSVLRLTRLSLDQRWDDMAEVDLAISADDVAAWTRPGTEVSP